MPDFSEEALQDKLFLKNKQAVSSAGFPLQITNFTKTQVQKDCVSIQRCYATKKTVFFPLLC